MKWKEKLNEMKQNSKEIESEGKREQGGKRKDRELWKSKRECERERVREKMCERMRERERVRQFPRFSAEARSTVGAARATRYAHGAHEYVHVVLRGGQNRARE